jgi:hypothetical protein
VKPNPLENGMRVYADGVPFIGDGDILEGMCVYANGEDMSPALIYHTSISATWTATLKGPAGKFVTFDWGDGSAPTTLELSAGGVDFVHDFSGGSGTGVIRIYGDIGDVTYINAHDNDIANIMSLSGLTSLDSLYLYNNDIIDISALSGLTNLKYLYLHGNDIIDISALSGLTSMISLYLYSNDIVDISALSGMSEITTLHLTYNSITDIAPLIGLSKLTLLYIYGNPIDYPLTGLNWFTAAAGTFRLDSTVDSSDEVNQWLIDLNDALWANCTVYLDGTNPPPTAAAAAAMAGLAGRGVTLIVSS